MADIKRVPALDPITAAELATDDLHLVWDTSAATLKRISRSELVAALAAWTVITADYVAVAGDRLRADTSAGAINVTLPDSPDDTDAPIMILDQDGTWPIHNLVLIGSFVGGATSVRCEDTAELSLRPQGGAWLVCL
ncbi:hypothetical protein [Reyranella sp.]|uniref:hypothetical protein n=1 Tax=Reyranella sp. TaxID=1929291 RepID=UPI003C7D055A